MDAALKTLEEHAKMQYPKAVHCRPTGSGRHIMKKQLMVTVPILALAVAGCVSTPLPPDSSASHPANPQAASSPVPPLQPGLLAITNMVMVKPVTNAPPEHQHGHGQHETKPKTEETK